MTARTLFSLAVKVLGLYFLVIGIANGSFAYAQLEFMYKHMPEDQWTTGFVIQIIVPAIVYIFAGIFFLSVSNVIAFLVVRLNERIEGLSGTWTKPLLLVALITVGIVISVSALGDLAKVAGSRIALLRDNGPDPPINIYDWANIASGGIRLLLGLGLVFGASGFVRLLVLVCNQLAPDIIPPERNNPENKTPEESSED